MNKIFALTLGLFLAVQSFAQDTETRKLSSFDEVSVATGIDAVLTEGSSEEIVIESDGVDLDDIVSEVSGGKLSVYIDKSFNRRVDVKVYITYRKLSALSASSGASIMVETKIYADGDFEIDASSAGEIEAFVKADELELDASSASEVRLEIEVMKLDADLSSAAEAELKGWAKTLNVEASSSGEFDGGGLSSDYADLRASSGAEIRAGVKERIKAKASSGGSISYTGNPKYTDKETSSGGSIDKD